MTSKAAQIIEIIDIPQGDRYDVFMRVLEVNDELSTMTDFLHANLCEEGTDHIAIGDAKEVIALNPGETMYIGNSTITRIK